MYIIITNSIVDTLVVPGTLYQFTTHYLSVNNQEMQESMSSLQGGSSMPSMEDMFTNFFGGGQSQQAAKKKTVKKIKQH